MVNSAPVKPEEEQTRRRGRTAGGNGEDEVQELGGDAEVRECGHVGRAIRREGDMHEGDSDTRELEETAEGRQLSEKRGKGDVGDVGVDTRRYDCGCARGFGLVKRARKEVDERRHDDVQRHSGETLVKKAGFTCAEHGGSRIQSGRRHGAGWRSRNAVDDYGLGTECA